MKKYLLPISVLLLFVLLIGVGCVPATGEDVTTPAVEEMPYPEGADTAEPYPADGDGELDIDPIPAEGTRPYPSLDEDDRPLEALPTPEISDPEAPGAGEGPRVIEQVPPDLLEALLDDVVARTGAERSTIRVIHSEQVVWPDGSLGCPQPGQMYTQALVDGYRVILEQGENQYDYRLADTGYFYLCENSLNLRRPPADAGTPTQ